jgi:hypothetical protein
MRIVGMAVFQQNFIYGAEDWTQGLTQARYMLYPSATSSTPVFGGFFFFFWGTGAWTQGLYLKPLHQPFFCDGFFWDRILPTICRGWLRTAIFLISASWGVRITGVSHQHLAKMLLFFFLSSTGVWTQDLTLARLARQALYHLSHSASHSAPIF